MAAASCCTASHALRVNFKLRFGCRTSHKFKKKNEKRHNNHDTKFYMHRCVYDRDEKLKLYSNNELHRLNWSMAYGKTVRNVWWWCTDATICTSLGNHFEMAFSCVWKEKKKTNSNLPVFTGRFKNSCCSAALRFTLDFIIHRHIIKTIASEIETQKRMHSAVAHSQTRIIIFIVLFASEHGRISFFYR